MTSTTQVDRTPRPCRHKRANHQHGTHLAFDKDGCRCPPCTQAARREAKRTRYRTETGTHSYVDAEQARQHVLSLLDQISIGQVEKRSGVNRTAIRVLVGDWPGKPPSKRITRKTEQALLAVTSEVFGTESHGLVDRTGTRRRMQALVAIGWPVRNLTRRLGMSTRTGSELVDDKRAAPVTASTRNAVARLYDEISMQPAPAGRTATRARRIAAERGWPPPMSWDDIDDPKAQPNTGNPLPRTGGNPTQIYLDDVEFLLDQQAFTPEGLADRLGVKAQSLYTKLIRAGRDDLWERLRRNRDRVAA